VVGVFVVRGYKKTRPIKSFNIGLLVTSIVCVWLARSLPQQYS
jgi:hypothetical protein